MTKINDYRFKIVFKNHLYPHGRGLESYTDFLSVAVNRIAKHLTEEGDQCKVFIQPSQRQLIAFKRTNGVIRAFDKDATSTESEYLEAFLSNESDI